jgi:hypothetical protein
MTAGSKHNTACAFAYSSLRPSQEPSSNVCLPPHAQVKEVPPIMAQASLFADPAIANLFFRTKNCLRLDKSTCFDACELHIAINRFLFIVESAKDCPTMQCGECQ